MSGGKSTRVRSTQMNMYEGAGNAKTGLTPSVGVPSAVARMLSFRGVNTIAPTAAPPPAPTTCTAITEIQITDIATFISGSTYSLTTSRTINKCEKLIINNIILNIPTGLILTNEGQIDILGANGILTNTLSIVGGVRSGGIINNKGIINNSKNIVNKFNINNSGGIINNDGGTITNTNSDVVFNNSGGIINNTGGTINNNANNLAFFYNPQNQSGCLNGSIIGGTFNGTAALTTCIT
jgi:hypothetical protein